MRSSAPALIEHLPTHWSDGGALALVAQSLTLLFPLTAGAQAVQELNLKPKNMRDLLTDEPFTRKDVIHIQVCHRCLGQSKGDGPGSAVNIGADRHGCTASKSPSRLVLLSQRSTACNTTTMQDPLNLSGKNLAEFDHVKKDLTVESAEERAAREVGDWRRTRGSEGSLPLQNMRRVCGGQLCGRGRAPRRFLRNPRPAGEPFQAHIDARLPLARPTRCMACGP